MPKLSDRDEALRVVGAFPGTPQRPPDALIDGVALDRQICAESHCPGCHHLGMEGICYTDADQSYRAMLAYCAACDEAFTF